MSDGIDSNMNKFLKISGIILANIFFIALILIVFDWFLLASDTYSKAQPVNLNYTLGFPDRFQQHLPYDESKPPILVIGCSFAYGSEIEQNESFPYKLQELTGRNVLNYSMPGHGVQHLLYKLEHSTIVEQTQPEYVVYIFIEDHLRRMYKTFREKFDTVKYLKYKKHNNILYAEFPPSQELEFQDRIKITYLAKMFNEFMFRLKSDRAKFNLLKLYLIQANNTLKAKSPNSKLVVMVYNSRHNTLSDRSKPFKTTRWNELEQEGIIIIDFSTPEYDYLTKPKFNSNHKDKFRPTHPSSLAWEVLTPIVIQKLGLN